MKSLSGSVALALLLATAQARPATAPTNDTTTPAVANKQAADLAKGDPARWTIPDTTPKAQLHTLRKEINAALQEALIDYRRHPPSNQRQCIQRQCTQQARAIHQQDLANARLQHEGTSR